MNHHGGEPEATRDMETETILALAGIGGTLAAGAIGAVVAPLTTGVVQRKNALHAQQVAAYGDFLGMASRLVHTHADGATWPEQGVPESFTAEVLSLAIGRVLLVSGGPVKQLAEDFEAERRKFTAAMFHHARLAATAKESGVRNLRFSPSSPP